IGGRQDVVQVVVGVVEDMVVWLEHGKAPDFSPNGAVVLSQGCEPLVRSINGLFEPRRGGSSHYRPSGASLLERTLLQGLAPLAMHGRPSGAALLERSLLQGLAPLAMHGRPSGAAVPLLSARASGAALLERTLLQGGWHPWLCTVARPGLHFLRELSSRG